MQYSKYFTIKTVIISIAILILAITTGGLVYFILKKNRKNNASL